MKTPPNAYSGYRYPAEIISHAVWLYHRFTLSFSGIEDILAERVIIVSYETIRQWCLKFGLDYAKKLRKRQRRLGDIGYMDEVSSRSMGNANISGVRSIRMAMSSIF